jgi:hypothetical protein
MAIVILVTIPVTREEISTLCLASVFPVTHINRWLDLMDTHTHTHTSQQKGWFIHHTLKFRENVA